MSIPVTRDDAFDWAADINRLATTDPLAWKAAVRQATACDWYMLAMFMSRSQRIDPMTGRPELDCDFLFNFAREMQFDGNHVLDKSARGHWKSTWRNYVGATNVVINDPNAVIAIVAHTKDAAARHGHVTMDEWRTNVELKTAWDDVFYADPENESVLWNKENGCTVRRTLPATLPTLSWHSILLVPTGSRVSVFIIDDIESEATVESSDMRDKTLKRIGSLLETAGRLPTIWINGTAHHAQGVVAHLEAGGAFRMRCHPIEDETRPAPDIAALYDECGGVMPVVTGDGQVLPPAIRDIRLDGAPTYLHPLEVAMKRLHALSVPGGLDAYYRQNMGEARAGLQHRLDPDWIRYYDEDPVDRAAGGYGYIVIDPSKGLNDPTVARLEVTHDNGSISWVAALRRKLSPSQFAPALLAFASEWSDIVQIRQIRVEEFGQSTWSHLLRDYFDRMGKWVAPIIACSRHSTNNKESSGRHREWLGLEPLYRSGRRYYPRAGITVTDERGIEFDEVARYIRDEYKHFPQPAVDDGLAADYLLAVTKGRNEAGAMIDLSLEYPEYPDDSLVRQRAFRRHFDRHRGRGDDGEPTWMSAGLADDDTDEYSSYNYDADLATH